MHFRPQNETVSLKNEFVHLKKKKKKNSLSRANIWNVNVRNTVQNVWNVYTRHQVFLVVKHYLPSRFCNSRNSSIICFEAVLTTFEYVLVFSSSGKSVCGSIFPLFHCLYFSFFFFIFYLFSIVFQQ